MGFELSKKEIVKEIVKSGKDPVYFINTYCRISHPLKGLIKFDTYSTSLLIISCDKSITGEIRIWIFPNGFGSLKLSQELIFQHLVAEPVIVIILTLYMGGNYRWLIGRGLSEFYYIDQIPTSIDINEVLFIILFSIFISILATIYPAYSASKLEIKRILNNA